MSRMRADGSERMDCKEEAGRATKAAGASVGDDEDDEGGSWDADSEIEDSERSRNLGFSDDEVNELLCQGVKPWDDDAWVCFEFCLNDCFTY